MILLRVLRTDILVFLLLFGSFAFFQHSQPGWNVNSRFALTLAWAETGSPAVENYVTQPGLETQDLAEYNGHLYSDKSIGTSLLGVPAVWIVKGMEAIADTTVSTVTRRYLVTLLSVGVAGALSGVLLMRWLSLLWRRRQLDDSYYVVSTPAPAAAFTAITVTLGSMLFLYGTLFMSYLPAHMFLLATLLCIEKALELQSDDGAGFPLLIVFLAGIFGGLSALCEYTYAAALVMTAIYLVVRILAPTDKDDPQSAGYASRAPFAVASFVLYGVGGIIGIAPFLIYAMSIFGKPAIPYEYHLMPEFRDAMAQGFMGATWPDKDVLWLITFHPFRGIFFYSPVLLIGTVGLIWMAVRDGTLRDVALLSIACVTFYLLFNSAYYMWWGGWSFSPRHLAPAIPFMAVGLLPWFARRWTRWLTVAAAAAGVVVHTLVNATEPQTPDGGWQTALLRPDLVAFDYPGVFVHQTLARVRDGAWEWNLGNAMGLPGGWSLLVLVAWWLVLGGALLWRGKDS